MRSLEILIPEATTETFEKILLPMALPKNKDAEMIFSTNLIKQVCQATKFPCYRFAHNLEGHEYWRLKMGKITLEYIVTTNIETDNNAYVYQIFKDGQQIYKRVSNPKDIIIVHHKTDADNR